MLYVTREEFRTAATTPASAVTHAPRSGSVITAYKSFAACGRNAKSPNASHWDPITKMRRSPNYRFPLIQR